MQLPAAEFSMLDKCNNTKVGECARMMAGSEPWITLKRTAADVIQIIEDEASEVHVAKMQNEVIGFAIIKMKGAFIGYIQSIVINPAHRGKGIGNRFIGYLERRILSEQPNVFICVSSFNHEAKKLYERLGYETIGRLKDYIVKDHDEILMRKSIAPLSDFKREGE
jgi:ribosomal-protein-alanine N-acetyltransferase